MKRTYVKYLTAILYGLTAFLILTMLQLTLLRAPAAHAASNPQISIALPDGTMPVGHPGTRVHISGSGFPSGSLALYTTPVNDPNKCTDGDANLLPFENNTKVNVKGSGSFQLDSKWPANANNATTAYYLCAIDSNGNGTLSTTNFTVAQPVTLTATPPTTVQPGAQITLTGANWLPVQVVNVSTNIPVNGGQSFLGATATPDAQGNFTVTLTVPGDAPAGSYSIAASAPNEATQYMQIKQENAITIGAGTATPTATTTPTPTASPTVTPTATNGPTPTQQANGGGNTDGSGNAGGGGSITGGGSNLNVLMIGLAGLGVLLIIIGVIIWAASSGRSS